jgi:hypothetical protein
VSEETTYSIMLRVRRVTVEDAYVAVPVTDAIMTSDKEGAARIYSDAFVAEAVRISVDPRVEWQVESTTRNRTRFRAVAGRTPELRCVLC